MTGEHTPGAWKWRSGWLFRDNRVDGQFSSSTILLIRDPVMRPREGDAQLIAAAPDLLDAARMAMEVMASTEDTDTYQYRALADAVRKAGSA